MLNSIVIECLVLFICLVGVYLCSNHHDIWPNLDFWVLEVHSYISNHMPILLLYVFLKL